MNDYTLRKDFPLTSEQNEVLDFMLSRTKCINGCQTGFGKTYVGCTGATHILLKYPDTRVIILCPQKAVKAFRRELTEKLRIQYNELTSSKKQVNPNCRITIMTHTSLKNHIEYIQQLKEQGNRLVLLVDEAHCCDYDTLIQTNLGELKIGDIVTKQMKCKVFSYNEQRDKVELKPIVQYFENECMEDMYEISYETKGHIKTVKLTGGHPVYTKNRGYVNVEDLTTNDIILSISSHCDNCGKDLNRHNTKFYNDKNKSNRFYCNHSCKAQYEHDNHIGCDLVDYDEIGRKGSKTLKDLYNDKDSTLYKHKQNMIKNNPMFKEDIKNKMTQTLRRLSKEGKLNNNFKYGNGHISKAENFILEDMIKLGFSYNKGIHTKEYRELYPESKIPIVYKPDYINKDLKIAIEIDGNNHKSTKIKLLDEKKEKVLKFYGYTILRFSNEDVLSNKENVLKEIKKCIQKVK